jgi:hypothetical protein
VSYYCSNVHVPIKDKTDDVKDSFYEELEGVFDKFQKYHVTIMSGDFSAKVDTEDVFKLAVENETLHNITNDNGARTVNVAKCKNLTV